LWGAEQDSPLSFDLSSACEGEGRGGYVPPWGKKKKNI